MSASSSSSSYADASSSSPSSFASSFGSLGLGYTIAIAVGLLLLVSSIIISAYLCYRRRRRISASTNSSLNTSSSTANPNPDRTLPRIIFVAEGESDEENQIAGHACSPTGLDPAAIGSYPKFLFSSRNGGETTCSICLCEYREAEMLRLLPDCRHYFHLMCIDAWLRLNASCPVCRTSPMPTPLSTPLSELVPLAQYAADRRRRR